MRKVKEQTELVNELLPEMKRNLYPENPYITTRMHLTNLAVYLELIETLYSIEEDFFCTFTQEERKIIITFDPRISSMNYLPPPLND
ncbi:hypothetical protein AYI70_g861 [Smittium culicis]|uniref:Uncharacterized protein n=1 Tax=Smittium culicis TaxID=133412 RepID=A0A1R1YFB1_9FUNG|nr:hypothetical protein AYI70_g861 [Smittium culicis]